MPVDKNVSLPAASLSVLLNLALALSPFVLEWGQRPPLESLEPPLPHPLYRRLRILAAGVISRRMSFSPSQNHSAYRPMQRGRKGDDHPEAVSKGNGGWIPAQSVWTAKVKRLPPGKERWPARASSSKRRRCLRCACAAKLKSDPCGRSPSDGMLGSFEVTRCGDYQGSTGSAEVGLRST